jgi:hypothetical protein
MSNFAYRSGLGNVGSYQASAIPYLTSSLTIPVSSSTPYEVAFPNVTRFVIITNILDGASPNVPLRFGFSENGVKGVENTNYAILNNGESFEGEFRVTRLYLLSDDGALECNASVIAGLTTVSTKELENNWTGSVGVG